MLLSSNVIRNTTLGASKEIVTKEETLVNNTLEITKEEAEVLNEDVVDVSRETIEEILKNAETEAKSIIEDAKKERDKILEEAKKEASTIRQESYKEGYEKGVEEGQKEAEKLILDAEEHSNKIILSSNEVYKKYLSSKKNDIRKLIVEGYENIFLKAFEEDDILDNLLFSKIEETLNCKVFYIKVNSKYYDHLIERKIEWQQSLHGVEINIIKDQCLEDGVGIIVGEKGKIEVNLNSSLDEVKSIIENY